MHEVIVSYTGLGQIPRREKERVYKLFHPSPFPSVFSFTSLSFPHHILMLALCYTFLKTHPISSCTALHNTSYSTHRQAFLAQHHPHPPSPSFTRAISPTHGIEAYNSVTRYNSIPLSFLDTTYLEVIITVITSQRISFLHLPSPPSR